MKIPKKSVLSALMVCMVVILSGCVTPAHHGEQGSPPHAPSHGYLHTYHGHDIRYDAGLRVYLVIGMPHHYFHDGHYYRYHGGHWDYNRDFNQRWRRFDARRLPPGLAKKYRH